MAETKILNTGVTEDTPKNILFGAGTIHKGLKYVKGAGWNFKESLAGATSGGSKLDIVPEISQIEVDGIFVRTQGLDVKTGEKATMEVNFVELTQDIIKSATLGEDGESEDANYNLIVSKNKISKDDYLENIAFVGQKIDGTPIIAILPNAICTSGLSLEGKNKDKSVGKYTFECTAKTEEGIFDKLPWKIYYPKEVQEATETEEVEIEEIE